LGSTDEETKERVAKAGGEARAQDKEGLSEAGHKGGETVSQDKEHMSESHYRVLRILFLYRRTKSLESQGSSPVEVQF
jgi:hypothetical protein